MEYGPWLRAPPPSNRAGGAKEWRRGQMGSAYSHNDGPMESRKERRYKAGEPATADVFSSGSFGTAATPAEAKWAEEHPRESSHMGEDWVAPDKGCDRYNINMEEENQDIPPNRIINDDFMKETGAGVFMGSEAQNGNVGKKLNDEEQWEYSGKGKMDQLGGGHKEGIYACGRGFFAWKEG